MRAVNTMPWGVVGSGAIVIALVSFLLPSKGISQSLEDQCNIVAGSPWEPSNVSSGRGTPDPRTIDWNEFIDSCLKLRDLQGDAISPETFYRIARGYFGYFLKNIELYNNDPDRACAYAPIDKVYTDVAESGYAPALYDLSLILDAGYCTPRDAKRAHELLIVAARDGFAPAQTTFAEQHLKEGSELFVQLIKAAAEQGFPRAQVRFGHMLRSGEFTPKDLPGSVRWYQKAAEAGYSEGKLWLGKSFEKGLGVDQDLEEAQRWLSSAADDGLTEAYFDLGFLQMKRGDPETAVQSGLLALFYWQSAAACDYSSVFWFLSELYNSGDLFQRDLVASYRWALIGLAKTPNTRKHLHEDDVKRITQNLSTSDQLLATKESESWLRKQKQCIHGNRRACGELFSLKIDERFLPKCL